MGHYCRYPRYVHIGKGKGSVWCLSVHPGCILSVTHQEAALVPSYCTFQPYCPRVNRWYTCLKCSLSKVMHIAAECLHDRQQTTYTFNGLFSGTTRWSSTRKVKLIWMLLKQETVSGSGISWAICKSAPHSREITMPAPHHSVFYKPDAIPATHSTASMHWRHLLQKKPKLKLFLYSVYLIIDVLVTQTAD